MCGRYTLKMTAAEAETFYGFPEIQQRRIEPTLPGFNIAPSQAVLVMLDDEGKPALTTARWGFAPRWWKSNVRDAAGGGVADVGPVDGWDGDLQWR